MGLQQSIQDALQTSIKNRDKELTSAVRIIIGEFQRQPEKDLSDEQVVAIIKKLVKSEKELLAASGEASSPFIEILNGYLPAQASEEEIRQWIIDNIDFAGFGNKMQAMRPIMAHFGSAADGNMVKSILQSID